MDSTQHYERWLIEPTSQSGNRQRPILAHDSEVDELVDGILDSGGDCYIHKITIH